MASSSLAPELSSAELRSKLFHSFKSKGVLQSVKTQLRKQLALELHKKTLASSSHCKEPLHDGALYQRVCNSLFVDHLKRCAYDYTLSVFISESLTSIDQAIPLIDILDLLNIKSNTKLHDTVANVCIDTTDVKGFLWTFLLSVAQAHGKSTTDNSVQTEDTSGTFPNLARKLFEIEKEELQKLQKSIKNDNESLEVKVLSFQRRYESQKQAELKNEMDRFRSLELANMRLEERERCQKEFLHMKEEQEKRYEEKLKEFERREEEFASRSTKLQKDSEKDEYEKRQQLLSEMDALKLRDLELQRQHKSAMHSVQIQEETLRSREEQLKLKEESMKGIEDHYENKLKHEILRVKLDLQEKKIEHATTMESREQQLKEEKMDFQLQKDIFLKWKEEAGRLKEHNEMINDTLAARQKSYDLLNQKYESMCEQLKKVCDYEEVKNENLLLHKEVQTSKQNIGDLSLERTQQKKEHQKLVRDLLNKINESAPEREKELKLLQEKEQAISVKYQMLQNTHELLQKNYMIQVRKNEELKKHYEQIMLSHRELLRECDDLKLSLHFANQEKETGRVESSKCKQSSVTVRTKPPSKVMHTTTQSIKSGKIKFPLQDIKQLLHEESVQRNIEDSNQVLQKLQQEAWELEKSYKQFQERQLHVGSANIAMNSDVHVTSNMLINSGTEVVYSSHVGITPRYDSFDLSRLIPSRTMADSNEMRDVPSNIPSTWSITNQHSTVMTQATSSLHTKGTLANNQPESYLSRPGLPTTLEAGEPMPSQQCKSRDVDAEDGRSSYVNTNHIPSNIASTQANGDTPGTKFQRINSLTQFPLSESILPMNSVTQMPLSETIRPMKSLTQMPLTETFLPTESIPPMGSLTQMPLLTESVPPIASLTEMPLMEAIRPLNSLTQMPLTESIVPMGSLTQMPLTETFLPMESLTQMPLAEAVRPTNPLTQMPLTETTQSMNNLTQKPPTEIEQPINSLTQLPLTETVLNNASLTQYPLDESLGSVGVRNSINGRTPNFSNIATSLTLVDNLKEVCIEALQTPVSTDFTIAKGDIFKTSDFKMKGLQSTRILSGGLQEESIETKKNNAVQREGIVSSDSFFETPQPAVTVKDVVSLSEKSTESSSEKPLSLKALRRHSTPDDEKNSNVESIQSLTGELSIKKDASQSSNVNSGSSVSQKEDSSSSEQNSELNVEELKMDKSVSEGEFGHRDLKSEGEVAHGNGKSEGEVATAVSANPMEQYMKMVLQRREADNNTKADTDIQHSIHDDLSLSEADVKSKSSARSSSDFEW